MRRKFISEQWLAAAFLGLLILAAVAGLLAPDNDLYHGSKRLAGIVDVSEAVQGSRMTGGVYALVHVRLDDGVETTACTPSGAPLRPGERVFIQKGSCGMDPDGNLVIKAQQK